MPSWDNVQDIVQRLQDECAEHGMSFVLVVAQPDKDLLNHACKSWVGLEDTNAIEDIDNELGDTMSRAFDVNEKIVRAQLDEEDDMGWVDDDDDE